MENYPSVYSNSGPKMAYRPKPPRRRPVPIRESVQSSAEISLISDLTDNEKPEAIPLKDHLCGIPLRTKWQQYRLSFVLFLSTLMCVIGTIIYGFLTSSQQPIAAVSNPKFTVLGLTIGTSVSVFLLGQLIGSITDSLRWTLAASSTGVDLATFLGIGTATGIFGMLALACSHNAQNYRIWCIQRFPIQIY
jgi:hypothetical protein